MFWNLTLTSRSGASSDEAVFNARTVHYRWDHADLPSFYNFTGYWLQPILNEINEVTYKFFNGDPVDFCSVIDTLYCNLVSVLNVAADYFVPQHKKDFFKFWWDEDLKLIKEESIESNLLWKNAGKP